MTSDISSVISASRYQGLPKNDTGTSKNPKLGDFLPQLPRLDPGKLDLTECPSNSRTVGSSSRDPCTSTLNSGRSRLSGTSDSQLSRIIQKEKLSTRFRNIQSSCAHTDVNGHDLCYICHQREKRNIPVDMKQDRKRRQEQEDEILLTYQKMRAENSLQQEQVSRVE